MTRDEDIAAVTALAIMQAHCDAKDAEIARLTTENAQPCPHCGGSRPTSGTPTGPRGA